MNYAVINKKTKLVENVVAVPDGAEWVVPPGCFLVPQGESSIGYMWDGKKFTNPAAEPVPELSYQDQRRSAYPPIGDQLDALYHAGLFPPEMAEKIAQVKSQYPKPEPESE